LEMYRLRGEHPNRQRKQPQKKYRNWLQLNAA
jgi:hypothetical protein